MGYLMYYSAFISWFDHFLDSGAEICQIVHCFFGKFKKSKRHSEIIWPLANSCSTYNKKSLLCATSHSSNRGIVCQRRQHKGKIIKKDDDNNKTQLQAPWANHKGYYLNCFDSRHTNHLCSRGHRPLCTTCLKKPAGSLWFQTYPALVMAIRVVGLQN